MANEPNVAEYQKKVEFLGGLTPRGLADDLIRPLMAELGLTFVGEPADGILLFSNQGPLGPEHTIVSVYCETISNAADSILPRVLAKTHEILQLEIGHGTALTAPQRVIIVNTGNVSRSAEEALRSGPGAGRVQVWRQADLIAHVDRCLPAIWTTVDIHKHSYLKTLAAELSAEVLPTQSVDARHNEAFLNAATDGRYVELSAYQITTKPVHRQGKVEFQQDIEEIAVIDLARRPEKHILLIGEAGQGKSTGMRRLAYVIANSALSQGSGELQIPIFLRAPDIVSAECATLPECAAQLAGASPAGERPFTIEDLEKGNVTFLIDALDEVAADDDKVIVMNQVTAMARSFPECRIIVTSRNYSSLADMPGYAALKRFTIQDISIQQAEKLVMNLTKARKPRDWEHTAANVLQRIQDVHGMGLNPLLVAVFVSTADDERPDIPANITELFKKWTELMLGRWEGSKSLSKQYQHNVKDFLLCAVAFRMHKRGERKMELSEFTEIISTLLAERGLSADIPELTDELLNRSGLLRVYPTSLEFRHHLIQEFFAGRGMPGDDFVTSVLSDEWWRTPIIFHFGENPTRGAALLQAFDAMTAMSGEEAMNAAISLGLALQACYLTETGDRKEVFRKVIHTFAECQEDVIKLVGDAERFRNFAIAFYYFIGKDAVALNALREFASDLISESTDVSEDIRDAVTFWVLTGLLETHNFAQAEKLIKKFRPKDARLLLALDMCCSLLEKTRSLRTGHRAPLKSIRKKLASRTEGIRQELFREIQQKLSEERNKLFQRALETHLEEHDQTVAAETESKNGSQPA